MYYAHHVLLLVLLYGLVFILAKRVVVVRVLLLVLDYLVCILLE